MIPTYFRKSACPDSGELTRVSQDYLIDSNGVSDLTRLVRELGDNSENRLIGIADFKNAVGVSRKFAIPLLEFLDSKKITRRAGDKRIVL